MKIHGDLDFTNTGSLVQAAIGVESGNDYPLDENTIIGRLAFFDKKLWIAAEIVADVPTWVQLTNEINSLVYDQVAPNTTWSIPHNLDTLTPAVQVYDTAGTQIIPDAVTIVDENNLTITFGTAVAGDAIIISGDGIGAISGGGGGSGTVTSVAAAQPAAGLTISGSPITTSGTLTFALADDLAAIEGLGTSGIVARTAADTWTTRTITGTANRISVTNGNGISGNPVLNIDTNYVGQSSITTLGTITTGVWTGTAIAIANGGTGEASANAAFNALAPSQTGNSGEFLTTDGTNTSWATVSASPAGSTTQIQYNNAGAFGADADFTWDATNNVLSVGSAGTPPTIQGTSSAVASGMTVTIRGGASSFATGAGGQLNLLGGLAQNGNGANVQITASGPNGASGTQGGSVGIQAANSTGTSITGGAVTILAGRGSATTGTGGAVTITSGAGGTTSGDSGGVTIATGIPQSGNAGTIALTGAQPVGVGAGGAITLTGGQGGNTSGTSGGITITAANSGSAAGTAGTVTISAGSSSAGTAGSLILNGGSASGGTPGPVTINGGSSNTNAGAINLTGAAGASTGTGGAINLNAGANNNASGTGGSITLNAGTGNGTSGTGGSITLQAGNATGGTTSGKVRLFGGGGPNGTGNVEIQGGNAFGSAIPGSPVTILGGQGNTTGTGGAVSITGGFSSGAGTGGALSLIGGGAGNSGTGGNVSIAGGSPSVGTNGGAILFSTGAATTVTERFRILPNGAWSVGTGGTATGTATFVLTSAGSGGPPTWAAAGAAPITGSVSVTLTGFTTTVTGTMFYIVSNGVVTLYTTANIQGTSNAGSMTIATTTLPAAVRPAQTRWVPGLLTDNSGNVLGVASISPTGGMTFNNSGAIAGMTNGGTKGIVQGWSVTYPL